MVGEGDGRCAVDVVDGDDHRAPRLRAGGVDGREVERVDAGLIEVRLPLEQARLDVEGRARRQSGQAAIDEQIAVGIRADEVELQRRVFLSADRRDRHEEGRAVGLRDGDRDGFAAVGSAVGRRQNDAAVGARRFVARRPGEHARDRIELGAWGQGVALDRIGDGVTVGVERGQLDRQRCALGNRAVAHRQQHRRGIGRAGRDAHGLAVGQAGRIGDGEGDVAHASIRRGRRPAEAGTAVDA